MKLREALQRAREERRSAFIPFIVAGDPDMAMSEKLIIGLQKAGADALELGVPFSDPVADGVTVQRAAERSLAAGTTLKGVLELVKRARTRSVTMPICLFSYVNPVYKMGYANFVKAAKTAGANGALLVDLPPEEATEYCKIARENAFETVFLSSPTTSEERLRLIDACSTGFVYYVSREGVTGTQEALPQALAEKLSNLRRSLSNPLAVGFGISTPEHVAQLAGRVDGIVVGSALIKLVEQNPANAVEAVTEKVRALKG
ncbi:MAG: tryptophan synthase subunit alpha [Alphaproteobacteria bacterium]|nr:MAG: tryptophan synthase subunit alpha [Alphaproteobacteria bacterium]